VAIGDLAAPSGPPLDAKSQESTLDTRFPREVQKRFEGAIASGEYAKGRLLVAGDLAPQYGVSLPEMRQLLRAAWRKGLVQRIAQGQFEVLGLVQAAYDSVFTHTDKAGFKPRSLVRDVEVEPATALIAEKLRVDVGSPVYRYVRTRFADDEPLANQVNYMPYEVCPGLETFDVTRHSFQKLLEQEYLSVFVGMDEHFSLIPATEQDREILGLSEGASILVVDRVALGATGWPLVWATIRIRPDRYPYVAALWPEAAKLLRPDSD